MSRFTIYSTTGTAKTEIEVLELHDEWMAECFVTVTVKSEEPIDFVIGDYIIYRDEKYAIDYDPTVIKKARRGSYGEGFVYDNIKFAHDAQSKIVRCDFTDIVLSPDSETNKIHYSSLPTFPFYCASVDDLLDRVQACLEELYPGQFVIIGLNSIRNKERGQAVGRRQEFIDAYKKYIDPAYIPSGQEATDPYGKQDVAETVDNISCWDALVKIHDDFDLNFIQRGNVIVAGTNGALTASTFRYGKGNGLYELERISDSSKQIVTRLRGYGNETNLPSRYYATLNMQVFANTLVAANGMVTVNLKYRTDYFLEVSPSGESILTTKIGDTEYPNSVVRINGMDGNVVVDTRTSVPIAAGTKIYFLDGVKKDAFPTENRDYSTNNLPDNMAVSRLMLPGFPNQSLADWVEAHKDDEDKDWLRAAITAGFEFSTNQYRPYIDSPNKEEYEIRPASIYFDGSDETDDIYPTIEEMEYQGHRIDQVVEAEQITDNGVFTKEGDIPNFKITLPDLGFNLLEYYEDGASIDMKSGMCGARSFEFAKKPTRDAQTGHWICTVKRVHDDALDLWFPYNDFQIRPNDKYVLIGIDMPDAYVNAASVKLLKASLEALDENDEPQYTYQPRIDEIWMQRQHNNSIGSAITSIHDTIKAGDIFQFEDADLGVSDGIIIDVLTIKENGNNGIPTYEVTLRNEKQVSTIQKAVEKAVSGSSAVSGSAGGYSGRQVYNAIENYGSDFFLSKNTDDVANGEIGFLKGLWIKVKGLFGISEDGNALLHDADMSGKVHVGEDLNVEGEILGTSAVLDEIRSSEYTGDGMLDTGYKLWYEEGRAKLVIDDLVARGKFTVNELEARKWTYAGGNMVFSGAGSTLFFVEYLDANENTLGYTNINAPWLLAGRPLLSAMVAWSKRRTVKRQLTDAEKAQVVKFRCYEYSDDGTMQTRNWWHVNDIAMCETLNKVKDKANSDGSYSGYASNTVYKRRVAGIGSKEIAVLNDGRVYDYVDLWNIYNVQGQTYINSQGQEATITDNVKGFLNMAPSGQTPSTDWPAAGDVIVQCGNPLDTDRQAVVTIEVQGTLHGFKVYDTINDYSMANKEWVEIGYDQTTGKAKSNIYGDFRFGCRENEEQNGGSYVKYNRTTKQLDIRANVRFTSPTTQQETTLDNFATAVTNELGDLQNQIDGEIDTWFYNGEPGPTVLPESDWVASDTETHTNNERLKHLGDLYYDNSSGYAYRYSNNGTEQSPVFYWNQISDSAVIKALENAAKAQDTADHKRRVFVAQPTPISPKTYVEYDVGDLWTNVTYPANYTGDTDESQHKYKNEILKCIAAKPIRNAEGEVTDGTFSINDWSLSNGYTSKLNDFVTNTYSRFVTDIQGQVDQKAETFRQATDPSLSWAAEDKPNHVGDIWMDISQNGGKKTYIYVDHGASANPRYDWEEQDVPEEVFDEIDGKAEIFVSKPLYYCERDMWIIGSEVTDTDMPANCQAGDIVVADNMPSGTTKRENSYVKGDWRKKDRYTDDTRANEAYQALTSFINETYAGFVTDITTQVDKKAETWYQATDPSTAWTTSIERDDHVGDIWHNTSNQTVGGVGANLDAIWNGTSWVVSDVPQSVYDKIDGKADIFVSKPSTYNVDDMWIIESNTTTCPDTDIPANCERGDIVFAKNKRTDSYTRTDWEKRDRYTDDSYAHNFDYMATAMKGDTQIQGALLLSSTIVLRDLDTSTTPATPTDVMAGMNGIVNTLLTNPDRSIAAWYGGDMVDLEAAATVDPSVRYAQALFRMDGTGYLAGGNISWNADGSGKVAGGNVSWNAAGDVTIQGTVVNATTKIDTPAIFLNGTDITATLNAILGMFEKDTTTQPGTTLIKANYSLYSVGDVSALGNSSGGGGGGGGASVLYELNDVTPNAAGNEVMGIVITDGQTTAGDGYVLTFDGSTKKWKAAPTTETYVLPQATSGALGGIKIGYTDATVGTRNYAVALDNDGKAYVNVPWTDTTYTLAGLMGSTAKGGTTQPIYWDGTEFKNTTYTLGKSVPADAVFTDHYDWNDITNKPSFDYLPLAGGTMTGNISVNADKGINIGSASARVYYEYVYRILGVQSISASTDGTNVLSLPAKGGTLAVTDDLSSYLPLAGGTMTGVMWRKMAADTSNYENAIGWLNRSGNAIAAIGYHNTAQKVFINPVGASEIYNDAVGKYSLVIGNNTLTYNTKEIATREWVQGHALEKLDWWNYGDSHDADDLTTGITFAYSNHNAPTTGTIVAFSCTTNGYALQLQGQYGGESLYFRNFNGDNGTWQAWRAILHSGNYNSYALPLSGGTLSGNVTINTGNGNDASICATNTNQSGTAIYLLASTNRGVYHSTAGWLVATNGTNSWMSIGNLGIGTDSPSQKLHVSGGLLRITNNSRTVDIGAQNSGAIHIYNDNSSPFFFNGDVCSNGVNTYDLGSTTYPWGSLYAAQCYIYGTAPSVHVGTGSNGRISLHWSNDSNRGLYDSSSAWLIGTNGTNTFMSRGNVGIGTTSPSYKLHVSGDIYATGDVTAASDQRKKEFVEDVVLTLEQIANAPAVKFRWKDDRDSLVHIGTYAQYWQDILPESVSDRGGDLGFTYGNTALVAVKNLARYVMQLEEEIRQLKKKQLKSA